ncbi:MULTISPECIES: efflux RND transporter periplasmic adaptor subunit [Myxococcus]|nr:MULTISPECIES: efflux RND transporter periplasmic adaptor subunit [Myxococcus]NOJ56669.1 efflux RND transporter periplasmic adaptor subunit [Myxococcus xanthus]QPM77546.1 efflux RND transporter periplasmic adaptor subunit [Myxococcus xanthus]QVW66613.1 efflux RND transporter periplasmic adaptor subunit [Myxococcus xanthus DZ2]QZZ52695.1 Multidrug resistance protein MdtA [Myxococcus xanthus]UEO07259.1 efflux RND transporter periplasmic adaptor subunit [Myxococcus xanthus DZ2]
MRLVNQMKAMWGVTLLAVVAGCSAQKAAPPAPPPREVEIVTLTPREVRETGEYLGSLMSRQSVNVLPQVAGYVRKIHVRPGDKVEAGAALIEVDSREGTAALDSAQAQLSSTQVSLELARRTLERTEALYKEGLASAQELEQGRAQVEAAQAAARSSAAQVTQRQVQLQYHVVRAPFAGTMGDVLVRLGDYVGMTTPLTSVAQSDVLEVSVSVPSPRARSMKPDTALEILDSTGKVLITSNVFYIAPQADPRTQLVEVKAAFRNTVGLRPSELVRARLVYSARDALQIPALAIVRQSGQPFALVVLAKDGKTVVERRPITLGALGEMAYVVESGLQSGDQVAVSSLQALRDGMAVKPKQANAPNAPTGSGPPRASGNGGGTVGGSR